MKHTNESLERAEKFFHDAIEKSKVYIIKAKDGYPLICPSTEFLHPDTNQALPVIPVWSENYLADAREFGKELQVMEIEFEEFFYGMLPQMRNDNLIIGLNWSHLGKGVEKQALEVIRDFSRALNKSKLEESKDREEKFYEEVFHDKMAYYLADKQTGMVFICPSYEAVNPATNQPTPVIPVWSKSYVETYAKEFGSEFEVEPMKLETLKDDLLQDMNKDGILLGINLDDNGFGVEVEASKVIMKLGGSIKS